VFIFVTQDVRMDEWKRTAGFSVVASMGVTVVLLAATGVTVAYTGRYNIAATEDRTSAVRWLLDTTLHNSVKCQAENVAASDLNVRHD
jgi:hypothetical protein